MNDDDLLINTVSTYNYNWADDAAATGFTATDISVIDPALLSSINFDLSTVSVTSPTYTVASGDTITFPGFDIKEFEHTLPSIEKVEQMCEEYPALEKAYENFKLIYKLVHDDWISQKENPHG